MALPSVFAGSFEKAYNAPSAESHQYSLINVRPRIFDISPGQKIYVSVPESLINFYGNLTHNINDNSDYAEFVTPQAVAPIADALLKVTANLPNSQEQFADAVLSFVHQIHYNVTNPHYPVETLAEDTGDCVGLSTLAASIMEAGGLNVVLILYTGVTPEHMNVGVHLPYIPVYHTWLMAPTSFTYDNLTYWTAECTPEANWKVGDQSSALANAQANIISINTTQSLPPAQVSASLNAKLAPSIITINPSRSAQTTDTYGQRTLNISGQITPAIANQTVNIYIASGQNADDYYNAGIQTQDFNTTTDSNGTYNLYWNFTQSDTYYITASWNGAQNYAGSDSQTLPVFVGPQSYIQFSGLNYNYIFGQPSITAAATDFMQGLNHFLALPIGTNASISYSFIILQVGQTISNVPTEKITIPASIETISMGKRGLSVTIPIPAQTVTLPANVPAGLAPLILPDDFNQTIDNQFCFILQNSNWDNYSLNINGLSDIDLSSLQANDNVTITNATNKINEGTWYQVIINITDNTATTDLNSGNHTVIETTSTLYNTNQTVLLIANNEDAAMVLSNLTVNPQNAPIQQSRVSQNQKPTTVTSFPYVYLSVLFIASFGAAVVYVKKKKQITEKKENNGSQGEYVRDLCINLKS